MAVKFMNEADITRYDANIKKYIKDGYLLVKWFNDDIQAAINYGVANGINHVILESKTYTLTDQILLPSGFTLEGVAGATTLSMIGVNKPIIEHTGDITGYTHIKNMILIGDVTQPLNTGITLNDYYSTISGVKVINAGSFGISLTPTGASSTLVENKITNCTITNAQDSSFMLGPDNNGKITDGFLTNCISYGSSDNLAVAIGSGAGWTINGLHVYGHESCDIPIYINAAYNTIVDNVYIEGFKEYAIHFGQAQLNILVSNINVIVSSANSLGVITINKSGAFSFDCNITISNVNVLNSVKAGLDVITGIAWAINGVAKNITVCGDHASTTNLIAVAMIPYIKNSDKVNVNLTLGDESGPLVHGGEKVAKYVSGKYTGAGSQTFNFVLNDLADYAKICGRLMVHSCSWDDGVTRAACVQEFFLSLKTSTSKLAAYDVVAASGFTSAPAIAFNKSTNTLTVTLTDAASDAAGVCAVEILATY